MTVHPNLPVDHDPDGRERLRVIATIKATIAQDVADQIRLEPPTEDRWPADLLVACLVDWWHAQIDEAIDVGLTRAKWAAIEAEDFPLSVALHIALSRAGRRLAA